jgi:hypothetical protein
MTILLHNAVPYDRDCLGRRRCVGFLGGGAASVRRFILGGEDSFYFLALLPPEIRKYKGLPDFVPSNGWSLAGNLATKGSSI